MAVWGTPVAHEDDAERAVRAALELVDGVHALGEAKDVKLEARAGVLTGEAATRPSAVAESMVAGDMVNTASRLQSAAEPGTVYVGDSTYQAASRAIAFRQVGELTLKGKDAPVQAWQALRVVAELGGANRMAIEPPFVGRFEELRLLKELLHATGRDGKARVVSVTGIGGIGKSRLVWELEKYTDGLSELVAWHQGRCPAYGEGVTFWALLEMVRVRAGIAEGDEVPGARAKLTRTVEQYIADPEERAWVEPRLAFLLSLDERPQGSGEELFAAWRLFFERIAETNQVVMVFEDIQWADPGLLDFVSSLLEWSRNHPILVVTLSRPELADRRPDWGAGQRSFTSVHLDSLPDEAIEELVHGLVPEAPADAARRIVERSEGVPLYAVETIRMLADRGILAAGESAYELVQPLDDLEVPHTLHALIASRLDALDAEDRSLLQDASILGKSFTLDALASLSDRKETQLEPRLHELVKKDFLLLDADPRSPELGQYVFTQSLIREVAYGTLSRSDRRSRHLAAAHLFEAFDDEEFASIVASHYVEALAATPDGPEAKALAARARDWLRQASERAMSLGSAEQAFTYTEQALDFTADGDERRELSLLAAEAAGDALRHADQERYLREAADLAGAAGDVVSEARILGDLAHTLVEVDDDKGILELTEYVFARFGNEEDSVVRTYVAEARAFFHFARMEYDKSLEWLEIALTGFEAIDDEARIERWIGSKVFMLEVVGRRRESLMLARGSVATLRRGGDLRGLTRALAMEGLALGSDDPRSSFESFLEAIAISRKAGFKGEEIRLLGNAMESAIELGEWDLAEQMVARLREAETLTTTISDALSLDLATLAAYRGDETGSVQHLSAVQRESAMTFGGWVPRIRSVVLTQSGDPDAGFDEGLAAIEIDRGGFNTPLAMGSASHAALWSPDQLALAGERIRRLLDATAALRGGWVTNVRGSLLAGLAALEGRREEAIAGYMAVLKIWKTMELPFDHAMTVGDAMTVLRPGAIPAEEVDAAVAFLEGIGAKPLLARIAVSRANPPSGLVEVGA